MSTAALSLPARLSLIAGAANVVTDPAALSRYEMDGARPAVAVRPGTADEAAEVVRFAATENLAVIPVGAGTKLRLGMPPVRYSVALDTTRLDRVLGYDPGDLTLSVEAGISLGKVQELLAEKGQFLPLLVSFYEQTTIGGTLASNTTSPLRQPYGTARDFLLGLEFITGEGVRAKSGGRVVKNVAGYDLHKLLVGSLGTLGILTAANFRTFPLPHATGAFVACFRGLEDALAMCRAVRASALAPHTLEVVSPAMTRVIDPERGATGHLRSASWCVMTATSGNERVVQRHAEELLRMAQQAGAGAFASVTPAERARLWGRLRELPRHLLEVSPAATLVRISALPTTFPELARQVRDLADQAGLPCAVLLRLAGIIYAALLPMAADDPTLAKLATFCVEAFHAAQRAGGRAVIEWCPVELKRRVNVWGPHSDDFALMKKVKQVFDPLGILAPGRFVGGL